MSSIKIVVLTLSAMMAFAGNSLLCRLALKGTAIDAASFTTIRIVSGAIVLWLVVRVRRGSSSGTSGSFQSAMALFVYAAGFSFAYVSLPASLGALLLFGSVQAAMIGHAMWAGERLRILQIIGLMIALGGLIGVLAPGLTAPPLWGSILMVCAGAAWGVYSLRGKGSGDPIQVTAGNFMRAVPFAAALSVLMSRHATLDSAGVVCAVLSGAIASGLGYAVWYTVLPVLKGTHAASVQLSVPVLASVGGIAFLHEPITGRLVLGSLAILGGISLVIWEKQRASEPHSRSIASPERLP